jgi:ABC-type amino acid transport system permease subunit
LRTLIVLAGAGQLCLAAASLAIPRVLGWRAELAQLRPLTRQVFWTYAAYIWSFHVAFGLLSAFAPGRLLDGSPLAGAVSGFIALYWGVRLVLQFAVFDRSAAPPGRWPRLAEAALVTLFVGLTLVYGAAAYANLTAAPAGIP